MKQVIELKEGMENIIIDKDSDILMLFQGGHLDTAFKLIFNEPNIKSDIKIKAVIRSSDVFKIEPLIRINKGSKGVTAHLSIDVLLLDEQISVKAKPSMEILENDVKVSHSLRVTKLNKDHLFYLNTKGLNDSSEVLIKAFLNRY